MENTTINIDRSGDLTLLVGDAEKDAKTFLVSSKVMQLASPVWTTLFDPQGRFLEANAKEVSLPDDDPDALSILLHIVHLKFDLVTGPHDFKKLLNLVVLCDKYDTVKLVRPWLCSWVETTPAKYCRPGNEEWLFIAWTFGLGTVYETLSRHLIYTAFIDASNRLINREGTLLGDTMLSGALEQIGSAREVTVNRLLALCRTLVERYTSSERVCRVSEPFSGDYEARIKQSQECDALVLGSLIKELCRSKLWPIPEATDVDMSASILGATLLDMDCYHKGVNGSRDSPAHEKCVFTTVSRKDVRSILDTMPSGVTATDRQHMHVQAEKAGQQEARS